MDLENKILQLEEENNSLREELETTKAHLRKYTSTQSARNYYTKNKDLIMERNKLRTNLKPTTPEMRKIYNQRSYLKRKQKEAEQKEKNDQVV